MSKVVIIGIDALDSVLLQMLKDSLPNFSALRSHTPELDFDGVFPPDSPTSWASIYTGLNPAKHGIVLFLDPLSKVSHMITEDVDDSTIRGNTFWDIASAHGKRVSIMLHLLGYPVWPVNGLMIGRSGINRKVDAYPAWVSRNYDISAFKWNLDLFPGANKKKFLRRAKEQIRSEAEFALRIWEDYDWDLFFVSFGELDVIQYSFWGHFDPKDQMFVPNNPYQEIIPDFYKLFDEIVGSFISRVDDETAFIVVSDHGIGSRPLNTVNINQILHDKGLLKSNEEVSGEFGNSLRSNVVQRIKNAIFDVVNKLDIGNLAALMLKQFPTSKQFFSMQENIDYNGSMAYLTDQSGIKVYPYGGIVLREELINPNKIERLRDSIVERLSNIVHPETGKPVFKWLTRREELYSGEYINRYPNILFELQEDFGAGSSLEGKIFGCALTHNIVPGCHKQHNATFLVRPPRNRAIARNSMNLMDVAPTILDLLSIGGKEEFDGHSLFEKSPE